MSEHTPLTEAERIEAVMVEHEYMLQNSRGSICRCGFVPAVDAESLKTQQDYHRAHVAAALAARTSTATADTGLRERVEALIHTPPRPDADRVQVDGRAFDSLRALLDATAAPTADTGARDE